MTYYTYFGQPNPAAAVDIKRRGPDRPVPNRAQARPGRSRLIGCQSDEAAPFAEAKRQLAAYFAGRLTAFDLPLAPQGTPFQRRVWDELRRVPHGQTVSYGELARRIGSPTACRAVGAANGRNPLCIIVPCHRVVGANGKLIGYAGGMPRKEALLALERGTLISVQRD